MSNVAYIIIWTVLLFFPLTAAIRRYWPAFVIYAVACAIFLVQMLRNHGGWDDLADAATLLTVIGPIYVVGSIAWLINYLKRKRK